MSLVQAETPEYAARARQRRQSGCRPLYDLLDVVRDPELPELSIWDLGVLQEVRQKGDVVQVFVTPTYSGCPALDLIRRDLIACLNAAGFADVQVAERLNPPWTTELLSRRARAQLRQGGVAPPDRAGVRCPLCGSAEVAQISAFGATACKALYRCNACREPFDHFKALK